MGLEVGTGTCGRDSLGVMSADIEALASETVLSLKHTEMLYTFALTHKTQTWQLLQHAQNKLARETAGEQQATSRLTDSFVDAMAWHRVLINCQPESRIGVMP